jgi:deoxyribodipyrimidine photolyase-related protein
MSDYCAGCAYSPRLKNGPRACPFNYLYWHFLMANEARLQGIPRMGLAYRNLARLSDARRAQIARDAEAFLAEMERRSGRGW